MNNLRYEWDEERKLTAIHRSPAARYYPTPEEIKMWMSSGSAPMPDDEPERCWTCGRADHCICPGCACNASLAPKTRYTRFKRVDPTGTE